MTTKALAARPEPLPETAAARRLGRLNSPTVQIAYRIAGIEVRNAFTDSLKRFTDYVDEKGHASSGGRGIYIQLSRHINSTFGLSRQMADEFLAGGSGSLRDSCSIIELLTLQMLEIDLKALLEAGMAAKQTRVDIKQNLYDCIETYGRDHEDRFARWRDGE